MNGTSIGRSPSIHVITERDVGLFSLIQQVVSQVAWALSQRRVPIVLFGPNCAYWTPDGYAERATVWEYYFEPVIELSPAASVPAEVLAHIASHPAKTYNRLFHFDDGTTASSHFGDDPVFGGRTLRIPYHWQDPGRALRRHTARIMAEYVRPRAYIRDKVDAFRSAHLARGRVIGVHARGTDALHDPRAFRKNSLKLENYIREIESLLERMPDARIFIASDEQAVVDFMMQRWGDRVCACESFRSGVGGKGAGAGPNGWLMPAYIAGDRNVAARNGEEAVVEFLILAGSDYLVHNGSGLARTALLANEHLPHSNVHLANVSRLQLMRSQLNDAVQALGPTIRRRRKYFRSAMKRLIRR